MGAPASNGKLCTKLSDMSIGDYIKYWYVNPATAVNTGVGTFSSSGSGEEFVNNEYTPQQVSSYNQNGSFYFIKVDKSLLIADRYVQWVSPKVLTEGGYITGKLMSDGLIRCPTYSEIIKYAKNSTLNSNIVAADENVWKWKLLADSHMPILQDKSGGTQYSVSRVWDKTTPAYVGYDSCYSGMCGQGYSFVPVLELIDNSKSTNVWY